MELINAHEMHAIQTETGKENQKFAEFATLPTKGKGELGYVLDSSLVAIIVCGQRKLCSSNAAINYPCPSC